MFQIIKVPKSITVRIVTPQPEDTPFMPKSEKPKAKTKENKTFKIAKKLISGLAVGIFLGIGIFTLLKISGMSLNGIEASILVLTPSLFGLFASYIIL